MKKFLVFSILCFSLINITFGQINELTYKNGVCKNSQKLSPHEVRAIYANDAEALRVYNNGRSLGIAGYVVGIPCAFVFGWDLGARLAGGDGNVAMLSVGIAGTVLGITMGLIADSNIKKSVNIYNSNLKGKTAVCKIDFGVTRSGNIGMTINF